MNKQQSLVTIWENIFLHFIKTILSFKLLRFIQRTYIQNAREQKIIHFSSIHYVSVRMAMKVVIKTLAVLSSKE